MKSIEIKQHTKKTPWTYAMLDRRQREIAARVQAGGPGAILLSEVAPVITLGRRTGPGDLLLGREALGARGVEVYQADRGGLATYHGPGQWIVFVVDKLEVLTGNRRGVRKAVEMLLEVACSVARARGVDARIEPGPDLGVWSPRGKLAAVGIHVEKGVLLHGLAINCFRTETSFVGLRPCGLDKPVDFLLDWELERGVALEVREREFNAVGAEIVSRVRALFWRCR